MIWFKILLFFITLLLIPELVVSQKLEFSVSDEGILLLENNRPRFFYQTAVKSKNGEYPRANYVHPLYGHDGEVLTEDFPEDHVHHRGIFWGWHQLYAEGKRIADPWLLENISWDVRKTSTKVKGSTAKIEADVFWIQTSTQKAVVKEHVAIGYERLKEGVYALTFDIKLTALVDGVAIGGSEDAKGYGGFSPRFYLPADVRFYANTGKTEPQNLPVQAGPWVALHGSFNTSGTAPSGIVMMGEPDKLPSYQGWILRKSNSMQNMAFPGRKAIEIQKNKSLRFRNQLLVHRNLSMEEIEAYYKKFRSQ